MGIPGLYRWLVDRYPSTICCVVEVYGDTTKPNPNGVEFDNLYIDMNGVIHPCFHPEGLPAPFSYNEVFKSIFRYIDKVFSIVRPRKLLFLAVDGVAPRAKMNHQRIRRFRAAKEAEVKVGNSEGYKKLDSNVITPGTQFMDLLSSALQYYVHLRMNSDPAWSKIKVILSDSTVVGEGEHKILSYMRSQRNLPGYDPNTRHCFHGMDADLIMLALATHEIHISILREVITYGNIGKLTKRGSMICYLARLKFEFFNIWVLREYLERELLPNVKGKDFERLIDDFVLICLFVGNDFLPHLPSLDIAKGGIELLLIVYQEEFAKMGYLTDSSKVNLKSMEHFLQALGSHETAIFMERAQEERERKRKRSSFQDSASDVEIDNKFTKPIYYTQKFDCESHDINRIKTDTVLRYTEGVCWIMHYYYQGVCSWKWFYPYHYAPFASDFCGLDKLEIHFTVGQPLKPLDQLLGVLPAASAKALPLSYRELMTNESSPILDFYPKDAKIDWNGKKRIWQAVCKLPFIEESRLLSETVKVEHTLRAEEKQRNKFGLDRLFVHGFHHPLGSQIKEHHQQIQINPGLSGGMSGYLCFSGKPICPPSIPSPFFDNKQIEENHVKSVDYRCPSHVPHVPKLLSGVIMPPKILRSEDMPPPPMIWHATSSLSQPISSESISRGLEVGGEPKKRKREQVVRQAGEKNELNIQVHKKPENIEEQGEGNMVSVENTTNRKKHNKEVVKVEVQLVEGEDKMNGSVEGEHKKQEKMIAPQVHSIDETGGGISGEEETRSEMESHGILDSKVALVEEGPMSQKVNIEVVTNRNGQEEMENGGDNKRKKQKKRKRKRKSKSALGVDEKSNGIEVGEKTEKPFGKEQEIVDVVGSVEEEKSEKVNDLALENMEDKRKSKLQLKDSMVGTESEEVNEASNHHVEVSKRSLESDLQQEPVAESKRKRRKKKKEKDAASS